MRHDVKVMQLSDGRDLAWTDLGDPAGEVVMAFHGSPGRCHQFSVHDELARGSGVRLIAVDRPGYGHSSYQPKRSLGDFPNDVVQLADHLGLTSFAVIGHSAGGPHALACALALPSRLSGCGVLSGVAPLGGPGMTDGMLLPNRIQIAVYRHWPQALDPLAAGLWCLLVPVVEAALRHGRRDPASGLDRFNRMLPESDLKVLARSEIRAHLLAEPAEFTPYVARTSIQDMALCFRDWDFHLEEIEIPVHIWQGSDDRNLPPAHGQLLAQSIPRAVLHECPNEGHWLLVDHMNEILQTVTARAR